MFTLSVASASQYPRLVVVRHVLEDVCLSWTAACVLMFSAWISTGWRPVVPVFAQMLGTPITPTSESVWEFAIRQGGALAILVIVLFYYRRDYRDLVAWRSERDKILLDVVKEQTKASTEVASAIRESTIVMHQAKNMMARYQNPNQG